MTSLRWRGEGKDKGAEEEGEKTEEEKENLQRKGTTSTTGKRGREDIFTGKEKAAGVIRDHGCKESEATVKGTADAWTSRRWQLLLIILGEASFIVIYKVDTKITLLPALYFLRQLF